MLFLPILFCLVVCHCPSMLKTLGVVVVGGAFGYYLYDKAGTISSGDSNEKRWKAWRLRKYEAFPSKLLSRWWGSVNNTYVPVALRRPLLGLYVRRFHCNLDEAADPDLRHYENLGQFFRRSLKPDVRPIGAEVLVSPADGTIISCGIIANDETMEQIKGVNYTLSSFFGADLAKKFMTEKSRNSSRLFHCVIYLSPGDYHHFHSPADWSINRRRHVPGKLLSVAPFFLKQIPGLFSVNERVVLLGRWTHGLFSLTPVAATNVGNIELEFDRELVTNRKGQVINDLKYDAVKRTKGERIGAFHFGSTLVLVFEAPNGFRFRVTPGQTIKYGEDLGTVDRKAWWFDTKKL